MNKPKLTIQVTQALAYLEICILTDMLVSYHARYNKLLKEGLTGKKEFTNCKSFLQAIQAEIDMRKQSYVV